ncbi:class I SAM-dependent methyltransferase [Desulfopila inferna]|uniref:class I SAM-dependent methyltransferase n=1 Tax=Desulfopila inferna TaxID=468528 RepID=UPI0019641115|nr:class I SAM-dependent methyltransferase [Desulfopila inferna]MBM9603960.1 class I SAM-dependent methyltransferase [Desulfopila inferna]
MGQSASLSKGYHLYQLQRRCIVCDTVSAHIFTCIGAKSYWRCDTCQATFLDPADRVSIEEEYAYYCLHRNNPDDLKYRHFLSKLTAPLLQRLPRQAKGLDYGCGPGPALAGMLSEAGHRMSLFDLHFFPEQEPLSDLYDFITCTETIEHFHHPAKEFKRLDSLLRPGGWLAVMTCFQTDDTRFASWHYRRDPTHVVFYREKTLCHLAREFGWTCEIPVKDVALMRK